MAGEIIRKDFNGIIAYSQGLPNGRTLDVQKLPDGHVIGCIHRFEFLGERIGFTSFQDQLETYQAREKFSELSGLYDVQQKVQKEKSNL
jgi:hypothetical protein